MVMVVDDNADVGTAMTTLLQMGGLPARFVNNPLNALALILIDMPTLVVLDQCMPGMAGTDMLRAIRAIPDLNKVAVIIYSASVEGRDEAERLGALDWIDKTRDPLDTQQRISARYHFLAGGTIRRTADPMNAS